MNEHSSTVRKTYVYSFGKRNVYRSHLRVQRGFLSERKGKVTPYRWIENRKGAGTNGGESGARNLEAESIRSRAESTGGCVKLKTVTEIRRSWTRDTCRECFILYWIHFGEIETEDWCGQFYLFSVWGEQHSSVCDEGCGKERLAIVEAWMSEVTGFTWKAVSAFCVSVCRCNIVSALSS